MSAAACIRSPPGAITSTSGCANLSEEPQPATGRVASHRVLRIVRKGGKASTEPLAPIVLHTLETYVGERTSGPIFLNADGTDRLSYSTTYALIRRLAKRAAIASAHEISPHSLRHSFAPELLSSPSGTSRTRWVTPTRA